MMVIRAEIKEDGPAIRSVNESAFGSAREADLVDALRDVASPFVSLVAVEDDQVVGHILFSPVLVETESGGFGALALAPMAVLPGYQKRGIGSRLVREGLKECGRLGHRIVFVLGHAEYYPRFGFTTAREKGLTCEYPVPDEVFMVAELEPGVLRGRRGLVKYHPLFGKA